MPDPLSHVAINADDLPASLAFYKAVFDWDFSEYYPGFYRMEVPHEIGAVAVQQRRALLPDGRPTTGFECTIAVDDISTTVAAALAHGGAVLAEPVTIPGVGELAWLLDPGGNVVGAIKYTDP